MKKNTKPLFPERLYHIYNRGINGESLFREERNYAHFLDKYFKFLLPVADLHAYCLLRNHFHFMVQIKTQDEIRNYFRRKGTKVDAYSNDQLISRAFNSFFKSYSVSINNTYNRTGRLFEEPFLRIEVKHNAQITNLIKYIHKNPLKHGFVNEFRDYPYSSYPILLANEYTWLAKDKVLKWFGGIDEFVTSHMGTVADPLDIEEYFP